MVALPRPSLPQSSSDGLAIPRGLSEEPLPPQPTPAIRKPPLACRELKAALIASPRGLARTGYSTSAPPGRVRTFSSPHTNTTSRLSAKNDLSHLITARPSPYALIAGHGAALICRLDATHAHARRRAANAHHLIRQPALIQRMRAAKINRPKFPLDTRHPTHYSYIRTNYQQPTQKFFTTFF